jgi:hypothetical protein
MDVYILIREDQNDHGFVDTSISGVFATHESALAWMKQKQEKARSEGWRVNTNDAESYEGADWQVYWKVEEHDLL